MKSTLISEKEWYERVLKGLNPCNLLNHLEKKSYLQNNLKKKIKIKGNLSGFNTKSLDFFKTWIIIFNLINDIKLVEMDQMGNFFITQAPLTPQALFEILFLSYICCFFFHLHQGLTKCCTVIITLFFILMFLILYWTFYVGCIQYIL